MTESTTIPPVPVSPELRQQAEDVLQPGESLSGLVAESLVRTIEYRKARSEFVARGLASAGRARATGRYVPAARVIAKLERTLARAVRRSRDIGAAERALDAARRALELLALSPFPCRKVLAGNPFLREILIPFGSSGYLAMFEIGAGNAAMIIAVRHEREDDCF